MDQLTSVLVAIDFSPCSEVAFNEASRIAQRTGATLAALHVVDSSLFTPIPPDPLMPVGLLIEEARQAWSKFAARTSTKSPTVFSIEVGRVQDLIIDRVRRDRPSLLVVGAHSDLDAQRAIGSNAAACVQHAPSRVLVVRESQSGAYKRVVACVDFTETSRTALEQAIRIAALDGASLHVLHIFRDLWHKRSEAAKVGADLPALRQAQRASAFSRLEEFCRSLVHDLRALHAEYTVEQSSSHAEGIIAFAQRTGADLVVLGTRASWNLRDFLWGSTAERVVRECPCSILTVKPAGFGERA